MRLDGSAKRLRIYIGESDQWRGRPLYMALLETLKKEGLAGATVLRGVAGFGAHSRIHTASIEVLSGDLPFVVEVVDVGEVIDRALTIVGPMVREGLITLDEVQVIKYTHRYLNPLPGDRFVREVMTREVLSVNLRTSLAELASLLIDREIKAVPVVDQERRVLGIVSDGDILERGNGAVRIGLMERLDEATLAAQLTALRRSGKTAADVMTREVILTRDDASLAHATQLMVEHGLKRLPVVDKERRLCGMLSRVDVLRTVAEPKAGKPGTRPLASSGHTVGDVMDTNVPTVKADADLVEIVTLLVGAEIKRVAVLDEAGQVIGVITDGDVIARVRPEVRSGLLAALSGRAAAPASSEVALDLMSRNVLKGPRETPIPEAIRQMLEQKRKRFYVVDGDGRLLGGVDRPTLLRAVAGAVQSGA
jgi:CBS-domain-containing membrane protein/PII-like signaling protein